MDDLSQSGGGAAANASPIRSEPWLTRMRVSILLGITTLVSYGTLYYAFGVLAPDMSADTGLSLSLIYALFSAGLAVSALIAPRAGRLMDEANPGAVMAAGSLAAAAILAAWALVPGAVAYGVLLVAARLVSVLVLYEAAFVAAARLRPHSARRTITGITLIAGFASTAFWPLTQWLVTLWDWRVVSLVFAALHLVVCFPLHLALARILPEASRSDAGASAAGLSQGALPQGKTRRLVFVLLVAGLAANGFIIAAVHLHLIPMLGALGLAASAVMIGAVIGPAQVAGRMTEFVFGHRVSAMQVTLISVAALPAALVILLTGAPWLAAAVAFAALFGIGQGLVYITRGVLLLHLFGLSGYGALTGKANAVLLNVAAIAPFVTAAVFENLGVSTAVWMLVGVGMVSIASLSAVAMLTGGRALRE